jgi:hypothetical protein
VDFELTSDQVDLKEGVHKLLEGRFPIETVRAGFDRALWGELAEAGVFALRRSEADGGVGLGMAEAVLVFEELGAALVPGPLLATSWLRSCCRRRRGARRSWASSNGAARRCSWSTSTRSTGCWCSTTRPCGPCRPAR